MAGRAGHIEWQRVAVGDREGLVVPFRDGQGFADDLAGANPVHQAGAGQRVFLQRPRAPVDMHVDHVSGGQGRQGAEAVAAPAAGGGNRHFHAGLAQGSDHVDVEAPFQVIEKQLGGARLPGSPGLVLRQVVLFGKGLGRVHVQLGVPGY